MSSFRRLFAGLRREVRSPKHVPRFDEARCRHAALERHVGVESVLGVLADDRRRSYPEKEALTRALVAEQQGSPSSFWAAVLLVAYYPMLSRLRHRIYGDAFPADDLDQLVITSFLSVVEDYPLDQGLDRTAMRLRQRTQRRVFAVVRQEQRTREHLRPACPEDLEQISDASWPGARGDRRGEPRSPSEVADAVALLVEHAGDILDGESFDLVTATLICRRRIRAYLDRALPHLSSEERRRLYPRIKRRHSRTLARLRPVLDHLRCPGSDLSGLCLDGHSDEPTEVDER